MEEVLATVTSKGQITIPKDVREYLGVSAGDKVVFAIEPDGSVRLRVPEYPTVASLRGAAGKLEKPLSWEQMREIAYEDRFAKQGGESE